MAANRVFVLLWWGRGHRDALRDAVVEISRPRIVLGRIIGPFGD